MWRRLPAPKLARHFCWGALRACVGVRYSACRARHVGCGIVQSCEAALPAPLLRRRIHKTENVFLCVVCVCICVCVCMFVCLHSRMCGELSLQPTLFSWRALGFARSPPTLRARLSMSREIQASPSSKDGRNAALSPEVKKLPLPALTGNPAIDTDLKAKHALFLSMVEGMLRDPRLILPVYEKYQAQKELYEQEVMQEASHDEKFDKVSLVGKLEDGFVMQFLASRSDLSCGQILKMIRHDPEAHMQLLEYETQLNPLLKLATECIVKEICKRFLTSRGDLMGNPLKKMAAAITRTGALDWRQGCYRLTFDKEKLVKILFRNGDEIEVAEHIATDYALVQNWSDWRAALRKPPFPELKLHLLFLDTKTGPYRYPKPLTGKSKEYKAVVDTIRNKWEDDKEKAGMGTHLDRAAQEAKNKLTAAHKAKKSEQLKRAREKAAETLRAKRTKQMISLKA